MLSWRAGSAVWTGMVTMKDRVAEFLPDHFATPLISMEAAASGQWIPRRNDTRYPIPGRLNIFLTCAQMVVALTILTAASHTKNFYLLAVLAIIFAFIMQMGFCLAHEAVHRKLHRNRKLNTGMGILLFSLFPGSLHYFEVAHLLHHRRNRSDDELEDYVLPGENPWFKRIMFFLLISGLFWLLLPLTSIVVAMIPRRRITLPRPENDAGSFRKFAQFLNEVRPGRVRRDLLVTALVWMIAFPALHLRLASIAVCYAAFGFSWASQQYIYHVRTPRHAVLGAYDLQLWKPLEFLYLHFNYHLTHHLAEWVPWNYLPSIAAQQPTRGYVTTYFRLWRVPEGLAEAWPPQYQKSGPLPPEADRKTAISMELPW
jgi:fatty acid desaturase